MVSMFKHKRMIFPISLAVVVVVIIATIIILIFDAANHCYLHRQRRESFAGQHAGKVTHTPLHPDVAVLEPGHKQQVRKLLESHLIPSSKTWSHVRQKM